MCFGMKKHERTAYYILFEWKVRLYITYGIPGERTLPLPMQIEHFRTGQS